MAKKAKNSNSGAGDNTDILISPKSKEPASTFDSGAGLTSFISHNLASSVFLPEWLPYSYLDAKLVEKDGQVSYQTKDGMDVLVAISQEEMLKKLIDLSLL